MANHPQVLLLGNGINLAFGGTSWESLIRAINIRDDFDIDSLSSPLPLQAILVTNNNIKQAMDEQSEKFYGTIGTDEQKEILQELLGMGFDDILTTNYSYELEEVALGISEIRKSETNKINKIKRLSKHTSDHAETQFLLHTYNEVRYGESVNRVWHIHGESRKPNSMILGHYWYGSQLAKIKGILDDQKNSYYYLQTHDQSIERNSWVDSFILGDVYVLGFGFNLAELDLWWLLNRKAREKAKTGKVYFFEPESKQNCEKIELLKLLGAEIISCGMSQSVDENLVFDYKKFYHKSVKIVSDMIAR